MSETTEKPTHREKAMILIADLDLSDFTRDRLVPEIEKALQDAWGQGFDAATRLTIELHGDSRRFDKPEPPPEAL